MRLSLALSAIVAVAALSPPTARAQYRILGYDTPSYIQFSSQRFEVNGTETNAVITVVRTGDFRNPASVDYATQDGTAEGNVHFRPCGGTINFPAGQSMRTISIPIIREQPEPPKTFNVELVQTSEASLVITPTAEVEIQSLPTLSIAADAGGAVKLSWADVGAPYVLEAKADGEWQGILNAPTLVDGEWTLSVSGAAPMAWFRLRLNAQ
jgi:hypothetical protein